MRTRRTWDEIKAEIYRNLREAEAEAPTFEPELLLDLWNESKDLREMEMCDQHEGFFVRRFTTDIVIPSADQPAQYDIPEDAGRVKRVLRIFEDGSERALIRDEKYSETVERSATGSGDGYTPTFRLMGNRIVLEPPPTFAQAAGLAIEMEQATERFADDSSVLDDDWPVYAESLLILDTVIAAFDTEETQEGADPQVISGFRRRRNAYEARWWQFCAERTRGRTFATPFVQWD